MYRWRRKIQLFMEIKVRRTCSPIMSYHYQLAFTYNSSRSIISLNSVHNKHLNITYSHIIGIPCFTDQLFSVYFCSYIQSYNRCLLHALFTLFYHLLDIKGFDEQRDTQRHMLQIPCPTDPIKGQCEQGLSTPCSLQTDW